MILSKKDIRKSLLIKRRDLSNISDAIVSDILASNVLDNLNVIGIYYPLPGEINVLKLLELYPNKTFCFPKTENEIAFYKENDLNKFAPAKFNVYEPITNNFIKRDEIDGFIIPSVGITKDNKRIGYGKGYYDRYLEGYKGLKIGVIYKELNNVDILGDSYDISFDMIFEE